MRSRTHSSQNGFTLIELLVVLSIIGVLIGLRPAVQQLRVSTAQIQERPRLVPLAAGLRSFGGAADKIQRDLAALTAAAVQSGEQGSLPEGSLRTLCGDVLDMDNTAGLLLQQIAAQIGSDGDSRSMLRRAQAALTESQTSLRQLEAALSKVYSCGTTPVVEEGL